MRLALSSREESLNLQGLFFPSRRKFQERRLFYFPPVGNSLFGNLMLIPVCCYSLAVGNIPLACVWLRILVS